MTSPIPATQEYPAPRLPLLLPALITALAIALTPRLLSWTPAFAAFSLLCAVAAPILRRSHRGAGANRAVAAAVLLALLAAVPLLASGAGEREAQRAESRMREAESRNESPISRHANRILPPALAAFTRAVVLNDLSGLSAIDRASYRQTGLTHLLAISGMNVAVMALLFRLALAPLPLPGLARDLGAAAAVAVYVAGIGAPPSALRAALMAMAVLIARATQREAATANVLAGAAFLTLLWDPASIRDPGFQLSYAATIGLIVGTRPIQRMLPPRPRLLAPLVAGSLAAQVATLPIIAWHFAELSPVGIIANIAAIPIFAVLFPLSVLALAGVPLSADLAAHLHAALVQIIDAFARIPGASIAVPRPPLEAVLAALLLLLLPLLPASRMRRLSAVSLVVVAGLSLLLHRPAVGVYAIADAGGGIGIASISQPGQAEIIDGGLAGRSWLSALPELGITHTSRIALTDPRGLSPAGARRIATWASVETWSLPVSWRDSESSASLLGRLSPGSFIVFHREAPILARHPLAVMLADSVIPGTLSVRRDGDTVEVRSPDGTARRAFLKDSARARGI